MYGAEQYRSHPDGDMNLPRSSQEFVLDESPEHNLFTDGREDGDDHKCKHQFTRGMELSQKLGEFRRGIFTLACPLFESAREVRKVNARIPLNKDTVHRHEDDDDQYRHHGWHPIMTACHEKIRQ